VPKDGPCASESESACINKCTATLEGLALTCAQSIVEHSGLAGERCKKIGEVGMPIAFGPRPQKTSFACSEGDTCATCESLCPCTADKERCDGFTMTKTSDLTCKDACAGAATPAGACTGFGSGGSGGGGSCQRERTWSCGSDAYKIDCGCPTGKCACKKNGTTVQVINYPYTCSDPSNCNESLIPAGACGFPMP
jgi:hypothetical protein